MSRSICALFLFALMSVLFLCAAGPARADSPTGVTVIIENRAPANGTWLTPSWVAFHDGTFDTHTLSVAASAELERLAEDGDTGPMSLLFATGGAGTIQATIAHDGPMPQLAPGESMTMRFTIDGSVSENQYLSYASMVIPSNDAFVANDSPSAHRIFDGSGNFLGAYFTIYGTDVKDAGTEVNDELPQNTAFFGQSSPNTGVDENGVVHMHQGYLSPGGGGILDDPMFAGADFTAPGYEIARIIVVRSDTVVPGGNISGTWTEANSPYIIEGDVTVPAGQSLTIEPGVTVFSTSWYGFFVNGSLDAQGTPDAPILFTATPPGPGEPGWQGVRFVNAQGGHLAYCIMENGQTQSAAPRDRGAGIYCSGSDPIIEHCTVRDNHSTYGGAGIYCTQSNPTITDCVIEDNLAGYHSSARAGGIAAANCGGTIARNLIRRNVTSASGGFVAAHGYGGGLYLDNYSGVVAGNMIVDNEVHATGNTGTTAQGGGVYCRESSANPLFVNNTIVRNRAGVYTAAEDGAGIYFTYTDATVINTLVADNEGSGIHFGSSSTVNVASSDFHSNDLGDFTGENIPAGLGDIVTVNANNDPCDAFYNIFLDPQVADSSSFDYHLTVGSPCRNAGDNNAPGLDAVDFEGDPRIVQTLADIGADEFYFHLYHVGDAVPGQGVEIKIVGLPGTAPVTLGLGSGIQDPPLPTPHGDLYLPLPLSGSWNLGTVPQSGVLVLPVTVPAHWAPGEHRPLQALVGPWGGPISRLTNLLVLSVE